MKKITSNPTVIVVNYNSGSHLIHCLRALDDQSLRPNIIVIDNASQDESARGAYLAFPNITFLPLRYNVGFCRAVNIGVTRSSGDHFVLLNPDTVPDPSFIEEILAPFSQSDRIASVAGTLVFSSQPDIIASAGITFHRNGVAMDNKLGDSYSPEVAIEPIFGASGGAAAFRRTAFIDAGGFPEHYFMYLEDADIAWRLRLAGWESVWSSSALVRHAYSASAGEGSSFKRRLLARNRIWMIVRCIPGELLRATSGKMLLHDIAASGYASAKRNWPTVYGRVEALARIAPRLCERRSIQRSRTVPLEDLASWMAPPISPAALLKYQVLTNQLASEAKTS